MQESYDVEEEIEDRFGTIPHTVQNVIDIALIKAEANSMGITEISQNDKGLTIVFEAKRVDMKVISKMISQSKGSALFSAGERPYLIYRKMPGSQKEILSNIKFLLQSMKELK